MILKDSSAFSLLFLYSRNLDFYLYFISREIRSIMWKRISSILTSLGRLYTPRKLITRLRIFRTEEFIFLTCSTWSKCETNFDSVFRESGSSISSVYWSIFMVFWISIYGDLRRRARERVFECCWRGLLNRWRGRSSDSRGRSIIASGSADRKSVV